VLLNYFEVIFFVISVFRHHYFDFLFNNYSGKRRCY